MEVKPLSWQEAVVDAINKGDLEAFKKIYIGKSEANRGLLPFEKLVPVPAYSKGKKYFCPRAPTILMYAVLCERDEFVRYILKEKTVDLSIKADGMNAFHLSATTNDHKCFDELLKCSYYQINLEDSIDVTGVVYEGDRDKSTSILHIAASHRNYYVIIRLLNDIPSPIYFPKKRMPDDPNITENMVRRPPKYEDDIPDQLGAAVHNIDLVSKSGATALRIAVVMKDPLLVEYLIQKGADIDAPGEPLVSPRKQLQLLKEKPSNSKIPEDHPLNKIEQIFNNKDNLTSESNLESEMLQVQQKENTPIVEEEEEIGEEESIHENNLNLSCEEEGSPVVLDSIKTLQQTVESFDPSSASETTVNDLTVALQSLLKIMTTKQNKTVSNKKENINEVQCISCHSPFAALCQQCHKYYCQACNGKSNIHECIKD